MKENKETWELYHYDILKSWEPYVRSQLLSAFQNIPTFFCAMSGVFRDNDLEEWDYFILVELTVSSKGNF